MNANCHQKLGENPERTLLQNLQDEQVHRHLNFEFLASRTVRWTSVILSHQGLGTLVQQPTGTNIPPEPCFLASRRNDFFMTLGSKGAENACTVETVDALSECQASFHPPRAAFSVVEVIFFCLNRTSSIKVNLINLRLSWKNNFFKAL